MTIAMRLTNTPHITVCVCTYKREELLARLLAGLASLETKGEFTYSVVVADNDGSRSAEIAVSRAGRQSPVPLVYCAEPRQSIALARNRAVSAAVGDFIAFIDDDELPGSHWLLDLLRCCVRFDVAGVLGPVEPHFHECAPDWVKDGPFYRRRRHATGFRIGWQESRTGNVLFRRAILEGLPEPFRAEFRSGEDQDFFRRMMAAGHEFRWCDEAVVYEHVPPARWRRKVMLKRALLRGLTARLHPTCGVRSVLKSVAAVCIYVSALPVLVALGQRRFMTVLVRLCDHLGKLLGVVGINPIKEQYITK